MCVCVMKKKKDVYLGYVMNRPLLSINVQGHALAGPVRRD